MSFKGCYCEYDPCVCKSNKRWSWEEESYTSSSSSCKKEEDHYKKNDKHNKHDNEEECLAFGLLLNPASPALPVAPTSTITIPGTTFVDFTIAGGSFCTIPNPANNSITVLDNGFYNISFSGTLSGAATTAVGTFGVVPLIFVNDVPVFNDDTIDFVTLLGLPTPITSVKFNENEQLYLNAGDTVRAGFLTITGGGVVGPAVTYGNVSLLVNEVFDVPNSFSLGFYKNQLGAFAGSGQFPPNV